MLGLRNKRIQNNILNMAKKILVIDDEMLEIVRER